jgi:coniferyl-aldehyde dehydrogenase
MNLQDIPQAAAIPLEFLSCFTAQQKAYQAERNPSYAQRAADLRAMHRLLVDNREALIDAVNADYGCRSRFETIVA